MKKRSLRQKISLTIITVVLLVLLLVGLIFLLNARSIADTLIRSNREMGDISRQISSSSMTELTQNRLQALARDKAALADRIFLEFEQAVTTAATAAEALYAHAADYPPRDVEPPRMENDG